MARARARSEAPMAGYEDDFFAWTEQQAALLRSRKIDRLDFENLAEEIESMGRRDRREIESRLRVILLHLLKWQAQPGLRGPGWRHTIDEQRRMVEKRLKESPSLRAHLEDLVRDAYDDALRDAVHETGLPAQTFPATLPFSVGQLLDSDYLPPSCGGR